MIIDMIATFWLFSILSTTMLREIECMYETPVEQYEITPQSSSYLIPNSFLSEKRTKPSLSIANSLDVLRQRLMLEIARRQMRENTKQIEINRAHLKNVGKRVNQRDYLDVHRFGKDKTIPRNQDDDFHMKHLYSLKYLGV